MQENVLNMQGSALRGVVMRDGMMNIKQFCKDKYLNRKKMLRWLSGEDSYILAELAVKSHYFGHCVDRDPVVSDSELMNVVREATKVYYVDGDNVFHELQHIQSGDHVYVCFLRKDTVVQKVIHLAQYKNFYVHFSNTVNKEAVDHNITMQVVTHHAICNPACEFVIVTRDDFAEEVVAMLLSRGRNICKKMNIT
jgi:hypothetical protein